MSLDLRVYVKELSDDLIPRIVTRLNDYEMDVEIDPNFSFEKNHDFLQFKFRLKNSKFSKLLGKKLIIGLELYIQDFDLKLEKLRLQPKTGLFESLFGKKKDEIAFASPEVESQLKDCKKVVIFVWHAVDSFDLRFAAMASAILTKITNGVCSYPADNIWYDNENIVEEAFAEVKQYEDTVIESKLKFHEFEKW